MENIYIINNELRTISNGKLFQFNHRTLRQNPYCVYFN